MHLTTLRRPLPPGVSPIHPNPDERQRLGLALLRWDSDDAWKVGWEISTQVSRSKRLLPPPAQEKLDQTQQAVVEYLDREIDRLREKGTPDEWNKLYTSLIIEKRRAIDSILTGVIADLKLAP